MPKSSGGQKPGAGVARIRFIMVDAELPDGDLTQISQAIQNALKPQVVALPRAASNQFSTPAASAIQSQDSVDSDEIDATGGDEGEPAAPARASTRVAKPRPVRTPKVLDNLDMDTEPSFLSFVAGKKITSDRRRYLLAALWLKQHRSVSEVTVDHIYTCYRWAKWPVDIPDFGGTLRKLASIQHMKKKGKGKYEITHLGIAQAENDPKDAESE